MSFNHAFSIAFAVPGSSYSDWEDCLRNEKDKVISGLVARLKELIENNEEYLEALDSFDTYEESAA